MTPLHEEKLPEGSLYLEMSKISFLILFWVLTLGMSLYAQEEELVPEKNLTEVPTSAKEKINSFLDFINKKAYAAIIDEKEEKKILREKWKEFLGIDIFYPYYKAKEVEDWVSEKASVEFFNIKGKPKFEDNQIKYIFKIKF